MFNIIFSFSFPVPFVRNSDKIFPCLFLQIIKRANERGETVTSLSSRFINEFLLDMTELQCLPPTCEPRVTEHIEHIIELITKVQYCYKSN